MLIPNLVAIVRYEYTGVATFTIPFPFYTTQSIRIATQSRGVRDSINLVYNTDYTVIGVPAELGDSPTAFTSGTVTLTAAGIGKIKNLIAIYRITEQYQLYKYSELDPFPAKSHENALGRNTVMIQELQQQIDRAIKMDITYEGAAKSGDDLLAEINEIANRAEAAVTDAETAVTDAKAAVTQAQIEANNALLSATKAESIRNQLFDLSIKTESIPFGQVGYAYYNPYTGLLTLQVPRGEQGIQGEQGIAGPEGPKGPPGEIVGELNTIAFGNFRVNTNGILQLDFIGNGDMPTATINQVTGQVELTI